MGETVELDDISNLGGRSVPFDVCGGVGHPPGILPCPLDGEHLADRVGGRDPLASAVAGAADTTDDGVDPVLVPFGIGQSLEQQHRCALPHDEPVGTVAVGTGARGRKCADLAELHEARRAHVAVDTTGQDRVVVTLLQTFDRCIHRSHGGRAGGIDDEIRTVEVEKVGDTTGDDVGQLTGHRVLCDLGKAAVDTGGPLG